MKAIKLQITLSRIIIIFSLFIIPILWHFYPEKHLLFWDISLFSVFIVMSCRPLSIIFPKVKILKKLIFFRKAFGILSSAIVVNALVYKFVVDINELKYYFSLVNWDLYYPFLSRITEVTWIILLATSNTFSQKKLWKMWKKIHRLSYIYFVSWALIAWIYSPIKSYSLLWIVVLLWLYLFVRKLEFFSKKK